MTKERHRFPICPIPAAHNKHVPNPSPLRYPGGKTWLIPHARAWLGSPPRTRTLVEPFAGGATISLLALAENLADRAVLAEIDPGIAHFWRTLLSRPRTLAEAVRNIGTNVPEPPDSAAQHDAGIARAVQTLTENRTRFNGILNSRAGRTKDSERLYPQTIARRILSAGELAHRIQLLEGDGLALLEAAGHDPGARVFIDPPYGAPKTQSSGSRLYRRHDVQPPQVFQALSRSDGDFLMTYADDEEIADLVREHGFHAETVPLNLSGRPRSELAISRRAVFGATP
ncbi:MAG: hypothetical protein OXG35_06770 [Acidobacteria bacterium]|nr:hypothetical protein [Acidobacteriota bacterium]